MTIPGVSVIIPVYNGERFISRAVASALSQTFQDTEIIIIDDASTDQTKQAIFDSYSVLIGKKIRYYWNERNRERAYTRNRGCELATGEFLFFLDADDEWDATYIDQMTQVFQDGQWDVVSSFQRTFIDENSQPLRVSKKPLSADVGEIIFSSAVGYPTATVFRRIVFPEYLDRYIPREDWEIYIRSYLNGLRIRIVDNNRIRIRSHAARTSSNVIFWNSTMRVYEDYQAKVPPQYLGRFLFHVGEVCLRFGALRQGWQCIARSFRIAPRLLLDKRKTGSLLKRGFRLDKHYRYRLERASFQPRGSSSHPA